MFRIPYTANVEYTIYCIAGALMSLSWMPLLVNSVVKTSGWLVITMSPAKTDFETEVLFVSEHTTAYASVK